MAVPFIFANQSGPIPLNELDANFAQIPNFANTAGTVTESAQANITSLGTLITLAVLGNIAGNYLNSTGIVTSTVSVTGNATVGNINTGIISATTVSASAILGANVAFSGNAVVTGNVSGGNIVSSGRIVTTGNISGNNIAVSNIAISNDIEVLGNLVVAGNAIINGTTTTINAQTLNISDKDVVVANNVSTSVLIDGAGILAGSPTVSSLVYSHANSGWGTANNFNIGSNLSVAGSAFAITASNTTANTQLATTAFVRNIVPTGVITLWYGSILDIPSGWLLCNGSNGTPDLRDRFIVGAGNAYSVGATAGSDTVTPTGTVSATVGDTALTEAQMPKHYHLMLGPNSVNSPQGSGSQVGVYGGGTPDDGTQAYGTYSTGGNSASGTQTTGTASGDSHTHSLSASFAGNPNTNLPPYYALAYIMKA